MKKKEREGEKKGHNHVLFLVQWWITILI